MEDRLPPNLVVGEVSGERIANNLTRFARMLREVGFRTGPDAAIEAARALSHVGVAKRVDFYWTLHALFVEREDQRALFRQAFRLFWRHVDPLVEELDLLSSMEGVRTPDTRSQVSRRVDEAWRTHNPVPRDPTEVEVDHSGTASDAETLGAKDFEQMTGEEWETARRVASGLVLGLRPRRTRRFDPAGRGGLDVRATVRAAMRRGGEVTELRQRKRRMRPPPVVAICDISGSMSSYSRMFLHFMHGLCSCGTRAHGFVFATRLSCLDRCMRHGDPDVAVALAGKAARDWSGGTRIADALREFNRRWARRTLGQGAVVLLATDGLERGGDERVRELGFEAERLRKSCSRLIWLNPLLRSGSYEALARGARVLSRRTDETRPIHNLESLAELGLALAGRKHDDRTVH